MGYIFLALFAATLFIMYLAIRRAWSQTLYIGSIGAIFSTLFVILYALTYEKTSTAQAIFAGIVAGLGFSGAIMVIAVFFRTNQPSAEIRLAAQHPQERTTDERRNNHSTPSE